MKPKLIMPCRKCGKKIKVKSIDFKRKCEECKKK